LRWARAAHGPTSSRCPAANARPPFSAFFYRYRYLERFFSKIKHFRAVAARFESFPTSGKAAFTR
jgi:hypothetical protein